jgi:hypothetical protein
MGERWKARDKGMEIKGDLIMLDYENLTDEEMKLVYDGLMELNYGKYTIGQRNTIIMLKQELRSEASKRPLVVKKT